MLPHVQLILLFQLRVGGCYEMVLTTMNGLYRYRLGDVIKVVDFYYDTPVYEFSYRYYMHTEMSEIMLHIVTVRIILVQ